MKVVVAYDISRDDRRARLGAILAAHGARIQRSVYECFLTSEDLREVMAAAEELMDHRTDVVHAFPLCESCAAGRQSLGQDNAIHDDAYWVVI